MARGRTLEQHIAVFGESGSGKTVMVSSFYGASQEHAALKNKTFHIKADSVGIGARLHKNYLGMKNKGEVPEPTNFKAVSYSFSVLTKKGGPTGSKSGPVDSLRLVWHDYPGEWFESDVSGPEEEQRRLEGFKALLTSDVALILVDGQKLAENVGHEKAYLKSLFSNFKNGLLTVRGGLLDGGKPLVIFPRIWIVALSKADLHPEMDVFGFRDLIIENAEGEVTDLREVIEEMIDSPGALSVGQDFVLLSSAKFTPDKIEVTSRIGVDLILPIAAVLPLQQKMIWMKYKVLGHQAAVEVLGRAGDLVAVIFSAVAWGSKLPSPIARVISLVGGLIPKSVIDAALNTATDSLKSHYDEALAKQDFIKATLTGFALDLKRGEEDMILMTSPR